MNRSRCSHRGRSAQPLPTGPHVRVAAREASSGTSRRAQAASKSKPSRRCLQPRPSPPAERIAAGAQRLRGAGHRPARLRQNHLVRPPRHHPALERPAAQHSLRRCGGAALPGPGLFHAALAAARAAHRPHARELRGRDQPLHPRAPPVDQDGQELRLRGAGRLLRCAARSLPRPQPPARPLA